MGIEIVSRTRIAPVFTGKMSSDDRPCHVDGRPTIRTSCDAVYGCPVESDGAPGTREIGRAREDTSAVPADWLTVTVSSDS